MPVRCLNGLVISAFFLRVGRIAACVSASEMSTNLFAVHRPWRWGPPTSAGRAPRDAALRCQLEAYLLPSLSTSLPLTRCTLFSLSLRAVIEFIASILQILRPAYCHLSQDVPIVVIMQWENRV